MLYFDHLLSSSVHGIVAIALFAVHRDSLLSCWMHGVVPIMLFAVYRCRGQRSKQNWRHAVTFRHGWAYPERSRRKSGQTDRDRDKNREGDTERQRGGGGGRDGNRDRERETKMDRHRETDIQRTLTQKLCYTRIAV